MESRFFFTRLLAATLLVFLTGAQYETRNFTIENAPSLEWAKKFAETAEQCRSELALRWLGQPLPDWTEKCPIHITVGEHLGAGGATTFVFDNGAVYGWNMNIQGSAQRILDSVLPHEITHIVLADHLRQPVPRWLDEGAATTVEHSSEKENYRQLLRHFLQDDVKKCLPFNRMVAVKEYPSDPLPLYAQGFSVVEFLILFGDRHNGDGHRRLVRFAESGIRSGDWNAALRQHYGIANLGELQQNHWLAWVADENKTEESAAIPVRLAETGAVASYQSVYNKSSSSVPLKMEWDRNNFAEVNRPILLDAASTPIRR